MTHVRLASFIVIAATALASVPAHAGPGIAKTLDLAQGFAPQKDKQTAVGCLTSLTVGGKTLSADIQTKDPSTLTSATPTPQACVAVLQMVEWDTSVTGTFRFSGQVSAANKQAVAALLLTKPTNGEVKFQLTVSEYDPVAKVYFRSISSAAVLSGNLVTSGLDIASEASPEVASPVNYTLSVGVVPAPVARTITLATSNGAKLQKAWGRAVVRPTQSASGG